MNHLSFVLSNKKAYKEAQNEASNKVYKSVLIQLFSSLVKKKKLQKLLVQLHKDFPNALIIGATTAGEISSAKMYDNSTVISLTLFSKTTLKVKYTPQITQQSGKELSTKLCSKHTKAAILLSEGLNGKDYEGFIRGIKHSSPKLIIAGGLAGDNFKLKKTYIFLGTAVYKSGAVAVSFSGKNLFADNKYNLNWTPIGKEFTITSAKGNVVEEIDNQSAVAIFKKYLGKKVFQNNATELSNFQLLFKEGETVVSRTPMAADSSTITFAGPLKNGQKVQFGFSNASSVISGSNIISKKIYKNPAEAIYIYSCIARKTLLGKTLENEFKQFENIAPTAGFFTYGEFYSTTGDNALLNCTTTILVLSESAKTSKTKSIDTQNSDNLDKSTFNALTHFIKQTSIELNENVQLLQEYKDVVDAASLVSKTDINGNITYVNDNFCHVSQYSREEILGHSHNIVRDKNISKFVFKKMWSRILSGKTWKGLLSNRAKDGSIYYVNSTIMPIFDANGKIKEFIAVRQDVTKQIESKRRLKEKEQLVKAIFDNQDSIVLFSSKAEGMLNVNKKFFHYFDFKNFEDFKSQHDCICDLFIEEDGYIYPSKYPNWIDNVAVDQENKDTKAKMMTKDGLRIFNIMVKNVDNAYIINLYDITNLENAILQATASESAKSIFLANMSHEIRTPLNGILGFTDVLAKKNLDKDSARYVEIIHKSGQTLLSVVNDILDYSKLESGELSISHTKANLFKEMEATVSTFASLSKKKRINYYIYIDTTIPQLLQCDAQRIKQVMNNLISNAIKFTPNDGEVNVNISLISLHNKKAKIRFSVKDSGIGVAKEKIATIFQAFSQADNSISREFGGTGLGLSISSQYIQMMGSKIEIVSTLGKGSEFYFELTLDVVNQDYAIQKVQEQNSVKISILRSGDEKICEINNIIYSYLNAWQCDYNTIESFDEINQGTDILIVCARLFDQKSCQNTLSEFKDLQLIYIEGAQETFNCLHNNFHLLEQPMTGSSLFDKIITLTNIKNKTVCPETLIHRTEKTLQFTGNILIAEDNLTNQMLISILLEERGLAYKVVDNGQEAVDEVLQNDTYDMIFMDINMPVLDGISAIKILRKRNYTKPIVSLSANVIESDIISFKEAGADDTLHKPLVPKELDKILSTYTHKQNHESEIKYDQLDVDYISKNLAITNKNIIHKLLRSFVSSATKLIEKLQTGNITKDITHSIKGITGNFRFNILYKLATEFESSLDDWDENQHTKNKEIIISHLENIISKINLLE